MEGFDRLQRGPLPLAANGSQALAEQVECKSAGRIVSVLFARNQHREQHKSHCLGTVREAHIYHNGTVHLGKGERSASSSLLPFVCTMERTNCGYHNVNSGNFCASANLLRRNNIDQAYRIIVFSDGGSR